jgi:hypothetical protein
MTKRKPDDARSKRPGRVSPPPAVTSPPRCKTCGGRVMVHAGVAQCTVPGCDWHGKL